MPTPSTGTFTVIAASVNALGGGAWTRFDGGVDVISLVDVIRAYNDDTKFATVSPQTYGDAFGVEGFPDTTNIILNDGTPDEEILTFAGLPSGFTVTSLQLKFRVHVAIAGTTRPLKFWYNSVEVGDYISVSDPVGIVTYSHVVSPTPSLIGTFFATNFGFNQDGSGSEFGDSSFVFYSVWMEGTYETSLYTWSLNKEAARPGDEVSIISSGDPVTGPDLTEVENIHLLWDDPDLGPQDREILTEEFLEWIDIIIIFELPEDIPDDTEVTIVPTIFGGSVPIGTLTVYIANSSGMYKIVRDQNDDVKYIASHGTDEVEHVKIPDPYFRTGYIGG